MSTLTLILLVFAFVFACIAAFVMQGYARWHFGWMAIAFFLLSEILGNGARLLH